MAAIGGCLYGAYDARLDALMTQGAVASWVRPGQTRLFLSSSIVPPAAFQRTALYARIFPVLVATSNSTVFVRALDRRRIRAGGEAWGSNAHECGLSSGIYTLDSASGWFGARRSANFLKYSRDLKPFEGVLRIAGDGSQVGPPDMDSQQGDYVSCGARAMFEPLRLVRIPPAQRAVVAKLGRDLLKPDP